MSDQFRKLQKSFKNSAMDFLGVCVPAVQFNRSMNIAMTGTNLSDEQARILEQKLQDKHRAVAEMDWWWTMFCPTECYSQCLS